VQLNNRLLSIISYVAVLIGVVLGASGIVRGGSLFIAAGTLGIALKSRNFRRIEFYLPVVIAIALFALAIALPHGR
jgi:translation initiation factor 2B subunit (eIF-2B alpha/beta/delta family)